MGGASSLFEETDWEKADGKLRDTDVTLDGKPPTSVYTVVHLVKKQLVNHREYDVTDGGMNLLFTTKVVPGTICCFDVLGPGIDDYLFRITVDIGRRYWIVYRYDVPSFEGQIPDQTESEKAASQLERPVLLYKKCCVTVSWSRYMSVAAFYGPPTVEMIMAASPPEEDVLAGSVGASTEEADIIEADEGEDLFQQASVIGARMRERTSSTDSTELIAKPPAAATGSDVSIPTVEETKALDTANIEKVLDTEISTGESMDDLEIDETESQSGEDPTSLANTLRSSPSSTKDDASTDTFASSSTQNAQRAAQMASASAASLRTWFRQKSHDIREKSRGFLYSTTNAKHPLEGVIHLDKPLILCQEIYNRLIGNHQTSAVSKEKVLELLKQDAAQHFKEHPEEQEDFSADDPILTVEGKLVSSPEEKNDDDDSYPGNGKEESKSEDVAEHVPETGASNNSPTKDGREGDDSPQPKTDDEDSKEQPLVGYWKWEHSFRTQKMKMHLAKGTDLALHVVIAIIVNQVRYERNALAMTI